MEDFPFAPAQARAHRTVLALACAAFLAGCAGSGAGLDPSGRPAGNGGATGPLVADFDSIQQHVFSPICSVCHAGATAPKGLRLDATNSYALLVGVPSTEVPTLQRVHAGDPDGSYIIQKLEGHAAVGERMPLGGPYLDTATIAVIRQWISDGALRSASAGGGAQDALSMVPGGGESLPEAPAMAVLDLPRDFDASQLASVSLDVESLDPAGVPTTLATVQARLAAGNARALLFPMPKALPDGRYRLVLHVPDDGIPTLGAPLRLDAAGLPAAGFSLGGAQ